MVRGKREEEEERGRETPPFSLSPSCAHTTRLSTLVRDSTGLVKFIAAFFVATKKGLFDDGKIGANVSVTLMNFVPIAPAGACAQYSSSSFHRPSPRRLANLVRKPPPPLLPLSPGISQKV